MLQNYTPCELLEINPESLEIANSYLQLSDVQKVAETLQIPVAVVTQHLNKREVKSYINQVFFDLGFNNRFKMRAAMDAVLRKKFQELEEADQGSSKDIAELLSLSHKMSMEQLDREIQLEKLRGENQPKSQVNVQINEGGDGTRYGALIATLLGNANAQN